MNSIQDIWAGIMEILSAKLTTTSINTWFSDCEPIELEDGRLVLQTGTAFKRDIILQRFAPTIKAALNDLFSCEFELLVLTGEELAEYQEHKCQQNSLPEMDGYTFDNYIVGNSNKFAHAAALGVVKSPGSRAYNPLFIYGNSGLGKTHLLLAIGSAIHENDANAKIIYIKGDDFLNDMVRSLKEGTAEEFRQKYRNVDLFLVDDIQFIAGKESTQEEFFHTFNSIYESGHQIVLTSDRPPIAMAQLDDRLRTRFEGGLMADIQPPDVEMRMAIIRDKAGHMGMNLSSEVVEYISEKVTSNIRQIEGVVKRLTAYRDVTGNAITKSTVEKAISDVVHTGTYIPTPEDIIKETALYYQISVEEIKGQRRSKNIAMARHISIYLIRELTNLSLKDIGAYYEDRNHSTILSSIKKIEKDIKTDSEISGIIRDITSNINSRQR
ncbi:MAG: chromosomal replication initiator protein DnaA [Oscillospiraceae bacterium]|nr:chromosomal replication initiator protein DnaA [Oscillospiraceae bacterium]